jgi:cytochrome P450
VPVPTTALPAGPRVPRVAQAVLWGLRFPEFTQYLHRRYGSTYTVRIGGLPASVVTADRDAIRRLFTGDPLGKRHANDHLRPLFGERTVAVLEPVEHLARRKLLLPPFHGENVHAYADVVRRVVSDQLVRWRSGDVVSMLPVAQHLTLEVILHALLGVSDADMRLRVRAVFDAMTKLPGSAIGGYFPRLAARSRWNLPAERYWALRDELDRLLDHQIAATRASPQLAARDDILALLVNARDEEGLGLTDADLRDEMKTLIAAGHETTAAAITWGAALLAQHPEVRAKVLAAVDAGDKVYLDALVKEILRIRPPVPLAAVRRSLSPFRIGAHTIDANVPIFVNAYAVHHDPGLYPEPDRFRPERFLDGGSDPYAFIPFGGGAHRCLGATVAQMEVRVALSAILERYDLVPTTSCIAPQVRRGITLVPRDGGRIRVVTREPRRSPEIR